MELDAWRWEGELEGRLLPVAAGCLQQAGDGAFIRGRHLLSGALDLKEPLGPGGRAHLVQLLWRVGFRGRAHDPHRQLTAGHLLSRLLKKKGFELPFALPWRELWQAFHQVHFSKRSGQRFTGAIVRQKHAEAMMTLCKKARRYFDRSAWAELEEETRQELHLTHHPGCFRAQAMLGLLCPTNPSEAAVQLPQLLGGWIRCWIQLRGVADWDCRWMELLARLARDTAPGFDWTDWAGELFPRVLDALQLPTALKITSAAVAPSQQLLYMVPSKMDAVAYAAKLTAYMLPVNAVGTQQLEMTHSLIRQMQLALHPSNNSSSSARCAYFLQCLCHTLAKRSRHRCPLDAQSLRDLFAKTELACNMCLFSKSSFVRSCGVQAAKLWVDLLPQDAVSRLLDRAQQATAASAVVSPHQACAYLDLLSHVMPAVVRYAEPNPERLMLILDPVLDSIDANDATKTKIGLKVVNAIANSVWLVGDKLVDWTSSLLSRVLLVMAVKASAGERKARGDNAIRRVFKAIAAQGSERLIDDLRTRLWHQLGCLPDSASHAKNLGFLYEALARPQPALALKQYMPLLHERCMCANSLEAEVLYSLRVAAQIVRYAGSELLLHRAELVSMIQRSLGHSSRKVYKIGAKLLRRMLAGLTSTFITDVKLFRDECAHASDVVAIPQIPQPNEADFTWHRCSAEEMMQAQELTQMFVEPCLTRLETMASCVEDHECVEYWAELDRCLVVLRNSVCGLAHVLPLHDAPGDSEVFHTMRSRIARCCHRIHSGVLAAKSQPTLHALCSFIKLVNFLLTNHGASRKKQTKSRSAQKVHKSLHKNVTDVEMRWSPHIWSLYQLHRFRLSLCILDTSEEEEVPEWVLALLDDLTTLSLHEYSKVRKRSQHALEDFLRMYPGVTYSLALRLVNLLQDPNLQDHEVTGACYLLSSSNFMTQLVRNPQLWAGMTKAQTNPEQRSRKPSVTQRLEELFTTFAAGFVSLSSSSTIRDDIEAVPEQDMACPAASEDQHWKHMLIRSCGTLLAASPERTPISTLTHVTQMCVAQNPILHSIGINSLPSVLNHASSTVGSAAANSLSTRCLGDQEWVSTVFKRMTQNRWLRGERNRHSTANTGDVILIIFRTGLRLEPNEVPERFSTSAARFVCALVRSGMGNSQTQGECYRLLLDALDATIKEGCTDFSTLCVSAELMAGMIRALRVLEDDGAAWLWPRLSALIDQSPCGDQMLGVWRAALSYATRGRSQQGCLAWLQNGLADRASNLVDSQDAEGRKWLQLLVGCCEEQFSVRAPLEVQSLKVLGTAQMSSSSGLIRPLACKLLVLCMLELEPLGPSPVFVAAQEKVVAAANSNCPEPVWRGLVEAYISLLLIFARSYGGLFESYVGSSLVCLLDLSCLVQHKNTQNTIKFAVLSIATTQFHSKQAAMSVIDIVRDQISRGDWHRRKLLLVFLRQFLVENQFLGVRDEAVFTFVEDHLLVDLQLENQQAACDLYQTLCRCEPDVRLLVACVQRGTQQCQGQCPKSGDGLRLFHGGVLCLSAAIQSSPYDVPEFMPAAICLLAQHVQAPWPVCDTIKKLFVAFWQSHRDLWMEHQTAFDDEQLVTLSEAVAPASYYA